MKGGFSFWRPAWWASLCAVGFGGGSGAAAVLRVPGDHTTVQAAVAAASEGDIVEIQNSAVYTEDVTLDKALTVRGAAGQTPTIQAANRTERYRNLDLIGPDYFGIVVRAPAVRLENLTISNPADIPNFEGISSALAIFAPDCQVRNCTVTTVEQTPDDQVGILVADLEVLTLGEVPTGVVVEGCSFVTNKFGLVTSWYLAPSRQPEVTVRNCRFTAHTSGGMMVDNGRVTIEGCEFRDNRATALGVGGGGATVSRSLFTANNTAGGSATIFLSLDSRWSQTGEALIPGAIPPPSLTLRECRVYENGAGGPAVNVHEGVLTVDHCIFADNAGINIQMDDAGEPSAPAGLLIDHSDFYLSFDSSEIALADGGGAQEVEFRLRNSIVTEADDGWFVIDNFLTQPDQLARQDASWSAFYELRIPGVDVPGDNNRLFPQGLPAYRSVDPASPDYFLLAPGNELLTAGEDGTYMGSNGGRIAAVEDVRLTISIQDKRAVLCWNSVSGAQYRVEWKAKLGDANWTLGGTVAADSANTCWEDPTALGAARFYRIAAP